MRARGGAGARAARRAGMQQLSGRTSNKQTGRRTDGRTGRQPGGQAGRRRTHMTKPLRQKLSPKLCESLVPCAPNHRHLRRSTPSASPQKRPGPKNCESSALHKAKSRQHQAYHHPGNTTRRSQKNNQSPVLRQPKYRRACSHKKRKNPVLRQVDPQARPRRRPSPKKCESPVLRDTNYKLFRAIHPPAT